MESRTCEGCSGTVTTRFKKVRFCSVACARKRAPRTRSGPPPSKDRTRACPICLRNFVAKKDRIICCSQSCARAHDNARFGNNQWGGGYSKSNQGYVKVKAKGHPRADSRGYVLHHRLVMEAILGRYLDKDERVHHRNGIRDDNHPDNLELWVIQGQSTKDPAGQRAVDLAEHMIMRLSPEERQELLERFNDERTEPVPLVRSALHGCDCPVLLQAPCTAVRTVA